MQNLKLIFSGIACAWLLVTPLAVHATTTETPQRTPLVLPVGQHSLVHGGYPFVTPDGQYMEIASGANQRFWLESMSGKKYALPGRMPYVYGSTPNGDVVIWSPAGSGVMDYVLRPGVGIVRKFPDAGDWFAASTRFAAESSRGLWVTVDSNQSGAGPLTENWTDVGGRFVPLLNDAWQLAWSPNGDDLAAVLDGGGNNTSWLVIYNVLRHTRVVAPVNPFTLPRSSYTPFSGGLQWSAASSYLAVMTANGIWVYDTHAKSRPRSCQCIGRGALDRSTLCM